MGRIKKSENKEYLEKQILTYLGNKRKLLKQIAEEVENIQSELGKNKLTTLDLFSGSGIVARLLKQYSSHIYANDLEEYSYIINDCYLSNKKDLDIEEYNKYLQILLDKFNNEPVHGIISTHYSPKDDTNIQMGERTFYTNKNALFIDTFRKYIDEIVPEDMRKYFMARLLVESSIHVNTAGVFKGFYKDKITKIGKFGGTSEGALERIKGDFDMSAPILSNYTTKYTVFKEDANELIKKLPKVDIAYLDPPYNGHPYGSNYFMLNTILKNTEPEKISKVAGIPEDWNHSDYNNKKTALNSLEDVVSNLKAKYIIISYNNEGFISKDEMENMLTKYGSLKTRIIEYPSYRGGRKSETKSIRTNEYLFVLKKEK